MKQIYQIRSVTGEQESCSNLVYLDYAHACNALYDWYRLDVQSSFNSCFVVKVDDSKRLIEYSYVFDEIRTFVSIKELTLLDD